MRNYNPRAPRHRKQASSSIFLTAEHNHHVTISFDDKTKSLIERLDAAIEFIAGKLENVHVKETEHDEPAELSVNIPDDLITPKRLKRTYKTPECNFTKNVKWWEDKDGLHIKYKSTVVDTEWTTMKRLASMDEDSRLETIHEMLSESYTANKRTAYNQFATHMAAGLIQAPVGNPFLESPDPYAPMLAGLGLTSTFGDFGKGGVD